MRLIQLSKSEMRGLVGDQLLSKKAGQPFDWQREEQEKLRKYYAQKYFIHARTSRSLIEEKPDFLMNDRDRRYTVSDSFCLAEQIARAARIVHFHLDRHADAFPIFEFYNSNTIGFDDLLQKGKAIYTFIPFPDYLYLALDKKDYRPIQDSEIFDPHKERRRDQGDRVLKRESIDLMKTCGEILPGLRGPGFFPFIMPELRTRENFLKTRKIITNICRDRGRPQSNLIFDVMIDHEIVKPSDVEIVVVGRPLVRNKSLYKTLPEQEVFFKSSIIPKIREVYDRDILVVFIPWTLRGSNGYAYERSAWSKTEMIIATILDKCGQFL